jgi:hypothetical protein
MRNWEVEGNNGEKSKVSSTRGRVVTTHMNNTKHQGTRNQKKIYTPNKAEEGTDTFEGHSTLASALILRQYFQGL